MKQLYEMVKASGRFHDQMKSFCAPLVQNFGISHFYHARVTHTGHFYGINLNRSWEEHFLSNTSHLLIWPDKCQPRQVQSGVRLLQESDNPKLSQLLTTARNNYSVNFSLQFVEKSNYDLNMYGFAVNSANPIQHMGLIKEIPLLRLFIKRFQEEFKGLYSALDDNKVDLPTLLGPSFNKANAPAINCTPAREDLLRKLGIDIPAPLTDRELDVIKYLARSHSSTEAAAQLFISKRTIEHHIERIKEKFRTTSKATLISKIHDLESTGYFTF